MGEMEDILKDVFKQRLDKLGEEHGFGAVLEMYCLTLCNFLVESGFISEEDLIQRVMKEIDKFENTEEKPISIPFT